MQTYSHTYTHKHAHAYIHIHTHNVFFKESNSTLEIFEWLNIWEWTIQIFKKTMYLLPFYRNIFFVNIAKEKQSSLFCTYRLLFATIVVQHNISTAAIFLTNQFMGAIKYLTIVVVVLG